MDYNFEHMESSVNAVIATFGGIPQSMIRTKAEEESERYVSDLGLEGDEREVTKSNWKEMFIEGLISKITS